MARTALRSYARAVPPALEVWTLSGRRDVELDGDRVTVGKDEQNDLVLDDTTVSRLHAVLEQFPAGWCVTDVGSSNGTFLNGERIWAQQRLRHGDEVRVGRTRLLFRNSTDVGHSVTETEAESPAAHRTRARRAGGAVPAAARPGPLHRARARSVRSPPTWW